MPRIRPLGKAGSVHPSSRPGVSDETDDEEHANSDQHERNQLSKRCSSACQSGVRDEGLDDGDQGENERHDDDAGDELGAHLLDISHRVHGDRVPTECHHRDTRDDVVPEADSQGFVFHWIHAPSRSM